MTFLSLIGSVADPFNFDTAPDPRIRLMEAWIRIRPKIEKYQLFFLLITQQIIYYYINIENINSYEKNS